MAASGDKPNKLEVLRDFIRRSLDFIFGFENKKGDELDSWIYHAEGFVISPKEFYTLVEQKLTPLKIPGMEVELQEFAEGGLLSDQRSYLRLMRERLAITACAAPFGNLFFFSCRMVHVPVRVRLWHILVAITFFMVVGSLLLRPLGVFFTGIAQITLVFAIVGVLRNASGAGPLDLDAFLLKIPVLSPIYQDWFREETYYRHDTRSVYMTHFPELIRQLAEEVCATKGVKLEPYLQRTPPTADLRKPLPPGPTLPTT